MYEALDKLTSHLEVANDPERTRTALKATFLEDFYLFAKYCLDYKDMTLQAHGEMVSVLESSSPRKIIVVPRGTFKSSLGSVAYPIWKLLKNPNEAILLDSELYTNSKNLLREIKGHLVSERLTRIFGQQLGDKWDEGEIIIRGRTKNIKEASITVGGIGTTKVGQHYTCIIGDDYNSPQNSESVEKCQKVIDHVRYNLNILNPGGEYLFIGTRYAERDVIGFFLKDILGEHFLAEGKLKRGRPDLLAQTEMEIT